MLRPGDIVSERYRLDALLGVGSFGCVFRALDRINDSTVAIKLLRVGDAHALRRFKREFRSCSRLVHPNLIRLYGLSSDPAGWLLAMEFVEGCVLDLACAGPEIDPAARSTARQPSAWPPASTALAMRPSEAAARGQAATATFVASVLLPTGTFVAEAGLASGGPSASRTQGHFSTQSALLPGASRMQIRTLGDQRGAEEREREREELAAMVDAFGGIKPAAPAEIEFESVMRQMAAGLDAIHSGDLVHGDIKPANVIVRNDGLLKILDFGLASITRPNAELSGRVAGTIRYMSPELANAGRASVASDWYALAVTAAELLFGWPMLDALATEGYADLRALTLKLIADGRGRAPAVDPRLLESIGDALLEDPERRMAKLRRGWFGPYTRERIGNLPASWSWPMAVAGEGQDSERAMRRDLLRERDEDAVLSGPVLFGRDRELAQLEGLWRGRRGPQIVVLRGSSGIGKTSVCEGFIRRRRDDGEAVLCVPCLDDDRVRMATLDGLVDAIADELELNRHLRRAARALPEWPLLMAAFPVLAGFSGRRNRRGTGPVATELADAALPEALAQLLAGVADGRGLLMVFEDLHWGDAESAEIIGRVLQRLQHIHPFVLSSRRSEAALGDAFVTRLERAVAFEGGDLVRSDFELKPLDEPAARAMLLEGMGACEEELPPAVREAVPQAIGNSIGLPWALVQWSMALREAWHSGEAPVTHLNSLIDLRMASLSVAGARMMAYLACAQQGLDLGRLRRLVGIAVDLEHELADLLMTQLVERRVTSGQVTVVCRHKRLGKIIESWLERDRDRWRLLHLDLAHSLLSAPMRDPVRGLHHLQRAGKSKTARHLALRMAARVQAQGRYERAAMFFAIAARSSPRPEELQLDMWAQARAYVDAGMLNQAEAVMTSLLGARAYKLPELREGQDRGLHEVALLRLACDVPIAQSPDSHARARALAVSVGLSWPDSTAKAKAAFIAGITRLYLRRGAGRGLLPEMELPWAAYELREFRMRVACTLAAILAADDLARGAALYDQALKIAALDSDPMVVSRALAGAVHAAGIFKLPQAHRLRARLLQHLRQHGDARLHAPLWLGRTMVAYHQLRIPTAVAFASRARRAYELSGASAKAERYYVDAVQLHLYDVADDFKEVYRAACHIEFDVRGVDGEGSAAWGRALRGLAQVFRGETAAAYGMLRRARAALREDDLGISRFAILRLRVWYFLATNRAHRALYRLKRAWPALIEAGLGEDSIVAAEAHSLLAVCALACMHQHQRGDQLGSSARRRVYQARSQTLREALAYLEGMKTELTTARARLYHLAKLAIEGRSLRFEAEIVRARESFAAVQIRVWVLLCEYLLLRWRGAEVEGTDLVRELAELGVARPDLFLRLRVPGLLDAVASTRR